MTLRNFNSTIIICNHKGMKKTASTTIQEWLMT